MSNMKIYQAFNLDLRALEMMLNNLNKKDKKS